MPPPGEIIMAQESVVDNQVSIDLDVYEAVENALDRLDILREIHAGLAIEVHNGIVTLNGVVVSAIMRHEVIRTVAGVPGVVKVVDRLIDDSQIKGAVAAALASDPELGIYQPAISINSYQGTVVLSGSALPAAQRSRACEIAAAIPGVRTVIEQIRKA
jgi:osmotically-inducible protein OsmY